MPVDPPVFAEPWQAQAFALATALQDRGVFTAGEWAGTLGTVLAEAAGRAKCLDGSDYYDHWVEALDRLLAAKGLTEPAAVSALAASWQRAAEATPHGRPIVLENDPQGSAQPPWPAPQ